MLPKLSIGESIVGAWRWKAISFYTDVYTFIPTSFEASGTSPRVGTRSEAQNEQSPFLIDFQEVWMCVWPQDYP